MKKSDELEIAIEAAKIGAKNALKYFDRNLEFDKKEDDSLVSLADKETEEVIMEFLSAQDASAKFLGEETGGNKDERSFWIVDPIDGTRCFSRGIPFWCVLISKYEDNEVKLATAYFPLMREGLYYAQKGQGAYCEDKKMHVSETKSFDNAYLTFGSLRHFKDKAPLMKLVDKVSGVRGYEPTYSSCLVAQGRIDINIDVFAQPWDAAPFKIMIEEAGGKITFIDGSPWTIYGRGFIATNGILHDEVVWLYNS